MFSSKEILDIALMIEQNGETVYRRAIKNLMQPELVDRLTWMADEEARHLEWFKKLQSKIEDNHASLEAGEMSTELLQSLVGGQGFTLDDVDFSKVDDVSRLIDIFIEFEKDGILFYEMLRTFINSPDVIEHLDQIITEEYRHIDTLQRIKNEIHVQI